MSIDDWTRRARATVDVGRVPPLSFRNRGGLIRKIAIGVLVLVALSSMYYQVNADEVGVVQRFGKVRADHRSRPAPQDPVYRGSHARARTATAEDGVWLPYDGSGIQSQFEQTPDTRAESLMLTGDLNVAVVEWIVQYKVEGPVQVPASRSGISTARPGAATRPPSAT